jgi:serine protease Do
MESNVMLKHTRSFAAGTIAGLLATGLAAYGFDILPNFGTKPSAPTATTLHSDPTPPPTAQPAMQILPDFTQLYERYGSAVVNISTTQKIRRPGSANLGDETFDELFRQFGFPIIPHGQLPRRGGNGNNSDDYDEVPGAGSGFIIASDGYIVTNYHVVKDADEVSVKLTDKREFKAKVIGSDKRTDVALIKIEAKNLPKVNIGNPSKLKVGEWVVAIGQPFGFDNTLTAGVVSAKGRSMHGEQDLVPFIQSDVAINPGNSGGPLFNLRGEVVGINSMIYSRNGGYMGVSFSIPIDVAMETVKQLREHGRVSRGKMGVAIQNITKEIAEAFGLSNTQGALVNSVMEGSAAERAGIESGDIILKYDGKSINSSDELPKIVSETKPGTTVHLQILRKGHPLELSLKLDENKDDLTAHASESKHEGSTDNLLAHALGIQARPLSEEQRQQLHLPAGGLLIEEAHRDGEWKGELREGDIILGAIDRGTLKPVSTVETLKDIVSHAHGYLVLRIRRGNMQSFMTLKRG